MAEVPSTFILKPGALAPDFALPDFNGKLHARSDLLAGKKGFLVAFVCNHCPFVIHLAEAFGTFAERVAADGIVTVAINANDAVRYPGDDPGKMAGFAAANGWRFPYLYDETQVVAKAYAAACTPDFYLFDGKGRLTYAGQFDDSRPGKGKIPTGSDLLSAVENLLSGSPTPEPWYPSTGCNIKWKPGQEPDYFA